ncbi:MAG TPA: hypothetical protein VNN80_15110 [Polyangiaceae bacterium]|nr:hypothetical protein [Polyangiaceae bacterium]
MNAHHVTHRSLLGSSCLSLIACSGLALVAAGCSEEDPTIIMNPAGSGGSQTAASGGGAGTPGSAGSPASAGTGGTASAAGGTEEHVSGDITANTTWTSGNTYVLDDITYVVSGVTLTIEPGTTIKGGGIGSALIVVRGGRLVAEGTAASPILFTSDIAEGLRGPGDWGGVALLGAAPTNVDGPQLEGIEALGGRGAYGGTDPAHDCGSLEYVRIEFAGFEFSMDNELNGLTLAGCGTGTNIDYVQVHRGSDDGIEIFGGTVDIHHVVLSNIQDDSLDWDFGWTGRAQFLVARHDAATSDAGFEADNGNPSTDVQPRSAPTIYNATLVGSAGSGSPGMVLRRGTWGTIYNTIVTGFPVSGVDIRDTFSVDGTATAPPSLLVANSIFFNNGTDGAEHGDADGTGDADDDGGFDENAYVRGEAFANRFDVDPGLASAADVSAPSFVPAAGSAAASGAATPPAGLDARATYVGAFAPGGADWTSGWTAYPQN